MTSPRTMNGTVTSFSADGFGFIAPDRGGGELWVRARSVVGDPPRELREGERVQFELDYGSMGLEAIDVRPLAT
jgi:CspA family cold shock protein